MWLTIDQRSSVPIYLQIVNGVKEAVAKGIVKPGDKLPTVREWAQAMTINPNTVAKAFQELEREGVIETMRGRGSFIAAEQPQIERGIKVKMIQEMLEKILVESYYLQLEEDELLQVMEQKVREWYRERRNQP